MTDASPAASKPALVARADVQYRWRVYVFFIIVFGYGLWSMRDGFFKWPQDNARWHEMESRGQMPPENYHNQAGILINQVLGVALPAISLPLFVWLMYRSRGAYRLADATLYVPGRRPIPLDRVQSLDKSRWDRKGIAVVEFHDADGRTQTIALRDMVYERRTTDQIVAQIEKSLQGGEAAAVPPQSAPGSSS